MPDDLRPKLLAMPQKPEPAKPWQPVEALREFLQDVITGKIEPANVMIFWVENRPDGRRVPHYWTAQVSILEQIGYGELIKTMAMEDWRET